jgi:hypothetical protein
LAFGLVTINDNKISGGIVIIAIIFIFLLTCPNTQAQTNTTFTPSTQFSIPDSNGSVSFGVNGTYSTVALENNAWTFTNLRLNGSLPLKNFQISTQNSNVTILYYVAINNTAFNIKSLVMGYTVEGKGTQILNFGFGPLAGDLNAKYEWTVTGNNTVFLNEGASWSVSNNQVMTVKGETGNVTLAHFIFSNTVVPKSNLPFYQQHSVAIAITIAVALVVVVAVLIKVKTKEKPV